MDLEKPMSKLLESLAGGLMLSATQEYDTCGEISKPRSASILETAYKLPLPTSCRAPQLQHQHLATVLTAMSQLLAQRCSGLEVTSCLAETFTWLYWCMHDYAAGDNTYHKFDKMKHPSGTLDTEGQVFYRASLGYE